MAIFSTILFSLLLTSEFIFLEPYLVGHIPDKSELSLLLIVMISILSGIVLSMNIYQLGIIRGNKKRGMGGSIAGSMIGTIAGVCGCGPIGFSLIATFGTGASVAFTFLENYDTHLRIISLILLVFFYFTTTRAISANCEIKSNN